MTLTLAASRHDLPPRWDGQLVEWGAWAPAPRICPPPREQSCPACGQVAARITAGGMLMPKAGATFEVPATRTLRRSGRTVTWGTKTVPAWPVIALHATRCTACGHDTVHDHRTDETWDLDESDYTDTGSWPEGKLW